MSKYDEIALKRTGALSISIGLVLIIVMMIATFTLQDLFWLWSYFVTAGIVFFVIGFVLTIAGTALESKSHIGEKIQSSGEEPVHAGSGKPE